MLLNTWKNSLLWWKSVDTTSNRIISPRTGGSRIKVQDTGENSKLMFTIVIWNGLETLINWIKDNENRTGWFTKEKENLLECICGLMIGW